VEGGEEYRARRDRWNLFGPPKKVLYKDIILTKSMVRFRYKYTTAHKVQGQGRSASSKIDGLNSVHVDVGGLTHSDEHTRGRGEVRVPIGLFSSRKSFEKRPTVI